jgi:hypothetical protein
MLKYSDPTSLAALEFEGKCVASAHTFVRGTLMGYIWREAQLAATLLWQETEKAPEQTGEWAETTAQLQDLSIRLYNNAWLAVEVEREVAQCHRFKQGDSRIPLTDAIAWTIIARLDESRNIKHTAAQVCPELFEDQTRRSQVLNAVHKNMGHLVRVGQILATFDAPSGSQLESAKMKKKKNKGRIKNARQDPAQQLDNPDGQTEKPEVTEEDEDDKPESETEDEFDMDTDSASIAHL